MKGRRKKTLFSILENKRNKSRKPEGEYLSSKRKGEKILISIQKKGGLERASRRKRHDCEEEKERGLKKSKKGENVVAGGGAHHSAEKGRKRKRYKFGERRNPHNCLIVEREKIAK